MAKVKVFVHATAADADTDGRAYDISSPDIPYSGKFSLGSYLRDFADCIRSRENKNRNNLFQQKFKGQFIWNRENKNRKNYFTHFYL